MIILLSFLWQGPMPYRIHVQSQMRPLPKCSTSFPTSQGVKHLILVDATWRFAREMAAVPEKESGRCEILTVINTQMLHVWNISYIWAMFGANVGTYSIHGASGI